MMMKEVAAIALVLAGVAGTATPAAATMVIQTTISGFTSSGFDFDLFELPDTGGPYSLVFRQQFPAPDLDGIPNVDHSGIGGTLFQVTFNYAGRSWDWFDIYQPGIANSRFPREVVYWNGSETLSTKDPLRNLQFYFESGIQQFSNGEDYGVTGALDMSNVFLPMTFIDWSSGYPVGSIAIEDLDIDLVGFYTLRIACFYDGCPGARSDATGTYIFRSDIRHVKVESFALPGGGQIPEPTTWALLITGFGLVGTAMRRRQQPAPTL